MPDFRPRRPRPSIAKRSRQLLGRTGPLAVWLAATTVTIWLGTQTVAVTALPALVDSAQGAVRTPTSGRLATLLVGLHDTVTPGQIVGRLDDGALRSQLKEAKLELERLRAELQREEHDRQEALRANTTNQQLEAGSERRRLQSDIESARLAVLGTRTELEETKVRLRGAKIEAERQTQLGEQGMVGGTTLVRIQTEQQALQKRADQLDYLLTEQRQRIEQAEQRLAAFQPGATAPTGLELALAPLRWRLEEQEAQLERIAQDGCDLDLRAPIGGRIAAVSCQAGEWLPSGTAILALVDPTPRRILAFAPERIATPLRAGQSVQVLRQDRSPLGRTTVLSVAPTLVELPARLWRDPQLPEWGREFVLATTGHELPGERLVVRP
jgi:multidrug resistance efflux pump